MPRAERPTEPAPSDRERWDARYRGELGQRRDPPDPFVLEALELVGPARGRAALDLAAGSGRHALHLARAGWRVEAWDVSPVALGILAERARAAGLAIVRREIDLLAPGTLPAVRFDLVLAIDFLDRPTWARLGELVQPGGFALLRTFTTDWPGEKPPAVYRLRVAELAGGLPGFETLLAREAGGRAGLLGRLRAG
jgi:SAM-dependent methyltransferase